MKYLNSMVNLNRVFMGITFLLYTTFYLGVLFQIALGACQVIISLVLLFHRDNLTVNAKENLLIYWKAILLFGICCLVNSFYQNNVFSIILYLVIPMIIAFCFSIFLEELKKEE